MNYEVQARFISGKTFKDCIDIFKRIGATKHLNIQFLPEVIRFSVINRPNTIALFIIETSSLTSYFCPSDLVEVRLLVSDFANSLERLSTKSDEVRISKFVGRGTLEVTINNVTNSVTIPAEEIDDDSDVNIVSLCRFADVPPIMTISVAELASLCKATKRNNHVVLSIYSNGLRVDRTGVGMKSSTTFGAVDSASPQLFSLNLIASNTKWISKWSSMKNGGVCKIYFIGSGGHFNIYDEAVRNPIVVIDTQVGDFGMLRILVSETIENH